MKPPGKIRLVAVLCVVWYCAGRAPSVCAQEVPLSAHLSTPADAGVRESLALLGMGQEFFESFEPGKPVDEAQQEKLLRLMLRLCQIPVTTLSKDARRALDVGQIEDDVVGHRGEVYALQLSVSRVDQVEVPQQLREVLAIDHYYRCEVESLGTPGVIECLTIPSAWKLGRDIEEPATALAMFIQPLPPSDREPAEEAPSEDASNRASVDGAAPLLFVTSRISWHPRTLLGSLGMDYGLFDDVKDRTALTERDAFYLMLGIVRHVSPEFLKRQINRHQKERSDLLDRMVRNRDLPAKMRSDAQRAWDRAQEGASDIVPLFNEPAEHRGELVVLKGEALRAIKVRVDDPDIVSRFNIDHYYEIEIVTPDSQNNPIVCCVTEVPPNMPLGDSIHEDVRVAGFFLKGWAFDTRKSTAESSEPGQGRPKQVAPLVIGKRVELLTTARIGAPTQSITLAVALAVVAVVCGAVMWWMRSADRRALAQLAEHRDSLPEQISLDASGVESGDRT